MPYSFSVMYDHSFCSPSRSSPLNVLFRLFRVAGWNQKERPLLHNIFHVGDKVLTVNRIPITSASKLWKLIKRADSETRFDFIIRRLPFGKAYYVRKNLDYEDIGMELKENSAEVRHSIVPVACPSISPAAGVSFRSLGQLEVPNCGQPTSVCAQVDYACLCLIIHC